MMTTALLSATLLALSPAAAGAAAPRCVSLTVDGPGAVAGDDERNGSKSQVGFSATKVSDVTLRLVADSGLTGDHLLEWRLFTPSNGVYQSITVPLGDQSGSRTVPGYPKPVEIVVPVSGPGRARQSSKTVERRFPIGGTMIVSGGIYGTWRLEANLDGAPFCQTFKFQITP